MYIHSFVNTHTLELFIIRLFTFDFALLNRERVYLEMTGLATPNFLTNAKFEIKCCIVFVFPLPSFITFWFCFVKPWEGFLGNDRISNPKFLDQCKIWNKCCIVCVFLPSSFVHNASELSLNYKFLFFPFQFTRLKLYY